MDIYYSSTSVSDASNAQNYSTIISLPDIALIGFSFSFAFFCIWSSYYCRVTYTVHSLPNGNHPNLIDFSWSDLCGQCGTVLRSEIRVLLFTKPFHICSWTPRNVWRQAHAAVLTWQGLLAVAIMPDIAALFQSSLPSATAVLSLRVDDCIIPGFGKFRG